MSGQEAQAQTRQTPGFGKGAADDQVGVFAHQRQSRLGVIGLISLVDEKNGVGIAAKPLGEPSQGHGLAGGVFRGGQDGHLGALVEDLLHAVQVRLQVFLDFNLHDVGLAQPQVVWY